MYSNIVIGDLGRAMHSNAECNQAFEELRGFWNEKKTELIALLGESDATQNIKTFFQKFNIFERECLESRPKFFFDMLNYSHTEVLLAETQKTVIHKINGHPLNQKLCHILEKLNVTYIKTHEEWVNSFKPKEAINV